MSQCDESEESGFSTELYYCTVGLGLLLTLTLNVFFAYRWHTRLSKSYRRKKIPMLSALAVTFMSYDRVARLLGVWLSYNAPAWMTAVWFHFTNVSSVVPIYMSVMLLMSIKLRSTFSGTSFRLRKKEIRTLYTLTFSNLICVCLFFTMNGFPVIYSHQIGQISLIVLALVTLVFSLTVVLKVDIGYGTKIRHLIAYQQSCVIRAQSRSVSLDGSVSIHSERPDFTSHNSDTFHESTQSDRTERPRLQNFNSNEKLLLSVAAKSMICSLWISLALCIVFSSCILFIFGHCANLSNLIAHLGLAMAYPIIASSISLSLPHSEKEFQMLCNSTMKWLLDLLAVQTHQTIIQKLSTMERSDIVATPTSDTTPTGATPTVGTATPVSRTPVSTL